MVLSWEKGADNGSALTGYEYRQSTDGGRTWGSWTTMAGSDASTTSHTVSGLSLPGSYTFEVQALNGVGSSGGGSPATGAWYAENGTGAVVAYPALSGRVWSKSGSDAGKFTLSTTGTLGFASAPDFEAPADADDDNVYRVQVKARSSSPPAVTQYAVSVRVTNVDEAGTVTVTPTQPKVGQSLIATLTDPDGSVVMDPEDPDEGWQWQALQPGPSGSWEPRTPDDGAVGTVSGSTSIYTPKSTDVGLVLRARASYTDGHGPDKVAAAETRAVVNKPSAPREFKATRGNGEVSLSWKAGARVRVGHRVLRDPLQDHQRRQVVGLVEGVGERLGAGHDPNGVDQRHGVHVSRCGPRTGSATARRPASRRPRPTSRAPRAALRRPGGTGRYP